MKTHWSTLELRQATRRSSSSASIDFAGDQARRLDACLLPEDCAANPDTAARPAGPVPGLALREQAQAAISDGPLRRAPRCRPDARRRSAAPCAHGFPGRSAVVSTPAATASGGRRKLKGEPRAILHRRGSTAPGGRPFHGGHFAPASNHPQDETCLHDKILRFPDRRSNLPRRICSTGRRHARRRGPVRDPVTGNSSTSGFYLRTRVVSETLTNADPGRATDLTSRPPWTVSEDALTWTFALRNNVRFHDGSDLTPEAVASTLFARAKPGPLCRTRRSLRSNRVTAQLS